MSFRVNGHVNIFRDSSNVETGKKLRQEVDIILVKGDNLAPMKSHLDCVLRTQTGSNNLIKVVTIVTRER